MLELISHVSPLVYRHHRAQILVLRPDKLEEFVDLIFESIEIALTSPISDTIERFKQEEAAENLREAFNVDAICGAAPAA
jgi:hypothetical protein